MYWWARKQFESELSLTEAVSCQSVSLGSNRFIVMKQVLKSFHFFPWEENDVNWNDILMVLWCCQWARSLDGSQSSKICTWNIFSVQTRQAGSTFSPLRLPPLLCFWCLSVQNTAGSNIQGWVYGGGQYYERSWGKLSLSLGDNNWHVRLQQMNTPQCLKYFGQNISFVPEKNSVNLFEHCQGLSLKVLISFFKDTFNENSHAKGRQCTMTDKKRQI